MNPNEIKKALADIAAETDPTLKHLKLASVVSSVFHARGFELVVVGGSAIEFYTDGAYTSGDLDFCLTSKTRIDLRTRQELMGALGGLGGPRSWEVAGLFVDILGEVETLSAKPFARLNAPYGQVLLIRPEDLLVERVLVSVYPQPDAQAAACARKLAAVALEGRVEMDWTEARRLATRPEYNIQPQLDALITEVSRELGTNNPCHP